MRIADYMLLSSKDIRRQPVRSGLTVLALMISTVILVTLISISLGTKHAIVEQLEMNNSLSSIIVTPTQNVGGSLLGGNVQIANDATSILTDGIAAQLNEIPHVTDASPRI